MLFKSKQTLKTMKKQFTLTIFVILMLCYAQTSTAQDLGNMLSTIANGIKPEAFKGGWSKIKDQWLKDIVNLDPSNLQQAGKSVTELVSNLKGDAFNPDMKGLKKDLLGNLANLSSPGKLGETLNSLVSGLNPNMLTSDFLSKKGDLLNGLKMLN